MIEIEEEFRIPGTNIILESGDQIEILQEKNDMAFERAMKAVRKGNDPELVLEVIFDTINDVIQGQGSAMEALDWIERRIDQNF